MSAVGTCPTHLSRFLHEERIGVLAVLLADGVPYASTLRFAHRESPALEIYFVTAKDSEKLSKLADGRAANASVVVGFSEEKWITVQMKGRAKILDSPQESEFAKELLFNKFPEWERHRDNEKVAWVKFTASWWKYSDLSEDDKVIFDSEEVALASLNDG